MNHLDCSLSGSQTCMNHSASQMWCLPTQSPPSARDDCFMTGKSWWRLGLTIDHTKPHAVEICRCFFDRFFRYSCYPRDNRKHVLNVHVKKKNTVLHQNLMKIFWVSRTFWIDSWNDCFTCLELQMHFVWSSSGFQLGHWTLDSCHSQPFWQGWCWVWDSWLQALSFISWKWLLTLLPSVVWVHVFIIELFHCLNHHKNDWRCSLQLWF